MAETGDKRDAMQRIRIGLTGLAGVLVLVLFAAAMLGLRTADAGARGGRTGARIAKAEAKDPLAELGVIPGGSGDSALAAPPPASTPRAAPPRLPASPPAGR